MRYQKGRKQVGLALGGGAARGLAHIGVLSALEDNNIPIDYIAGTSMGSMIGAAYSAGVEVPQLLAIAAETGWLDISRPKWPRHGLLSFAKMEQWVAKLIGDVDVRDLPIPFAAVATDIETGERVILREGPLGKVIRASCSVPGFVEPVEFQGRLLSDGGISDNLPDSAVRLLGADYVIGVDVFAPAFRSYLGPFGAMLAALETLVQHAGGGDLDADCLIIPKLVGKSFIRLSKFDELIDAGRQATLEMLPTIKSALGTDDELARITAAVNQPVLGTSS